MQYKYENISNNSVDVIVISHIMCYKKKWKNISLNKNSDKKMNEWREFESAENKNCSFFYIEAGRLCFVLNAHSLPPYLPRTVFPVSVFHIFFLEQKC